MASLDVTELDSNNTATDTTTGSFSTASVTLDPGHLYIVELHWRTVDGTLDGNATIAGTGVTVVDSIRSDQFSRQQICVFLLTVASQQTGALTVTWPGTDESTYYAYRVMKVESGDSTLVQTAVTANGSSTSPTVSYGSTTDAGNLSYGVVAVDASTPSITAPSGWSDNGTVETVSGGCALISHSVKNAETAYSPSLGASGSWQVVALEISALAAAAGGMQLVGGAGLVGSNG